jgi:hypothetical protein
MYIPGILVYIYSETCIKRSDLSQRKSGLIRQGDLLEKDSIHTKTNF